MLKKQIDIRLAVDVGGTFTDVVLKTPDTQTTAKVLTTTSTPKKAVIAGAKEVFEAVGIIKCDGVCKAAHVRTVE